jgi:hypothetical protein
MAKLVTTKFKIHNAEQFIESLEETSATNLYLYIGKVQEWDDENAPPAPNEAVANTLYNSGNYKKYSKCISLLLNDNRILNLIVKNADFEDFDTKAIKRIMNKLNIISLYEFKTFLKIL